MTARQTRPGRASTWRGWAQVGAAATALLAVADLCRWGNRWYVSTRAEGDEALRRLTGAHAALLSALVWLTLTALLVAWGWRLRLRRV